jgi:hypothetical protein
MNVGSTSVNHPPALQAGFYCGWYGSLRGIASLVRVGHSVVEARGAHFVNVVQDTLGTEAK